MSDRNMQFGDFCWNELMTMDVSKAKEFYGNLFGWKCEDVPVGDMVYTMIQNGDKGIGGIFQTPKEQQGHVPPHWMSYINVENLDAMVTKATSLGAKITVPATTCGDFGRFSVIQDPTGAHIAMWQTLKACSEKN